jgi:hypothetical protein
LQRKRFPELAGAPAFAGNELFDANFAMRPILKQTKVTGMVLSSRLSPVELEFVKVRLNRSDLDDDKLHFAYRKNLNRLLEESFIVAHICRSKFLHPDFVLNVLGTFIF